MPRAQGQHAPFDAKKNLGSGRYAIWRAMRIMRRFTVGDLVATTSSRRSAVHEYVVRLARVQYLAREQRLGNDPQIYRLTRDTGPYSPMLRRDGTVFDPNTQKVLGEVRT